MSSDLPDDDDEIDPPPQRSERFALPDDDQFNAWLFGDLPPEGADDFDVDPRLPPELQEEHDRLITKIEASTPSRLRLAPDLVELERKVEYAALHEHAPSVMIHRFQALASIRGGMGLVIKAYDPLFERLVAIKLLMRPSPGAREALLAEGVTLAKLKHRNVVTVYEPGLWNDHLYIVMEWIEGVDGHEWMRKPRSWRTVREVFLEAGSGLAAAHDAKIQHGDFKPSNILIGDDGRVVVADFGLADSFSSSSEREDSDAIAGTTSYMAPERLRGKRGDARSDQFSFCVAMFRALCRQWPFVGQTSAELIESIERAEIRRTPAADAPQWLLAALHKGLACSPDDRYRDMRELLDALRNEPPPDEGPHDGGVDDGVAEHEVRALHSSAAEKAPARWGYFAAALISSGVTLAGMNMLAQESTNAPAAGAVEIEPYIAILGLVAEDRFIEAQQLWQEYALVLTDAQTLQVARDCLMRARQSMGSGEQSQAEQAVAEQAAWAAQQVAGNVAQHGSTQQAKQAGAQLVAEAKIYGFIVAGEFAEARAAWVANESELSDEQSLQLARDCVARAKQFESADRRVLAAAATADLIATAVWRYGSTSEAREEGSRLVEEAKPLHEIGRPTSASD